MLRTADNFVVNSGDFVFSQTHGRILRVGRVLDTESLTLADKRGNELTGPIDRFTIWKDAFNLTGNVDGKLDDHAFESRVG